MTAINTLTITRPDDWHLHLRDGAALKAVLPDTAKQFARAIVMPNLRPPITTTALAIAYRERILSALESTVRPEPVEGHGSTNSPRTGVVEVEDDPTKGSLSSTSSPRTGFVEDKTMVQPIDVSSTGSPQTGVVEGYGSIIRQAYDSPRMGCRFEPLMTLYLTDNTTAEEIFLAKTSGIVHGIKLYPAGATTNSDSGVTNLGHCVKALEAMEKLGMPLLAHAEVTDNDVDVFDRERVFIERNMIPLLKKFPALKVVFEHITTKDAADFVTETASNVAATITAHHLLMNRNDMFKGGIQPHHYCLPILKREEHRVALVKAATSGNAKFFLGTDSAPHAKHTKEAACGCAGMYTAYTAMELYAEAFENANALDKLEGFASFYGADFYGLPRNKEKITLVKQSWQVPDSLPFDGDVLVPLRSGQMLGWQVLG